MFYPEKIIHVAEVRGLEFSQMAALGGISSKRFDEILKGDLVPSIRQIKNLAENLAVPYYAFFSKTFVLQDFPIVDFRNQAPEKLRMGANAKAIYRNIEIQAFFAELYQRLDIAAPEEIGAIDIDGNPEQMAQAIRYQLKLDEFQTTSISKKEFYRELRRRVQKLGVFVIQDHNISNEIDGFALFHEKFSANYIFLNSSIRNSGRRAFTLAHELAHILGKRSAVSNDYASDNDVELYCNTFAASLLLPRNLITDFVESQNLLFDSYEAAVESAKRISVNFNTSVSAVLVRVYQVGISHQNFYFKFAETFGDKEHPDTIRQDKQRGGPKEGPDQGLLAKAYLGERGAALIAEAIKAGKTTPLEVCEKIGLSKKRVEGIVRVAAAEGLKL